MANPLNYNQILSSLRQKREQIEEAISVIERLAMSDGEPTSLPGATAHKSSTTGTPAKKKRHISAEGRKRIAEATRRRWAAKRAADAAAAKSSTKKTAGARKKRA